MLKTQVIMALAISGALLAGCQATASHSQTVSLTVEDPFIEVPGSVSIGPAEPTYPFENPVGLGKDFRRGGPD